MSENKLKGVEPPYEMLKKHARELVREMDEEKDSHLDGLFNKTKDNNACRTRTENEISLLTGRIVN